MFRHYRWTRLRVRKVKGTTMSELYIVSGIIAAGIFVYLVAALLYPEKF